MTVPEAALQPSRVLPSAEPARPGYAAPRPRALRAHPRLDAALFARSSSFAGLSLEALDALRAAATPGQYGPNAFIYMQDDAARHLYVILSGHVRLSYLMEDGSAILHAILPSGESFGELGVFEQSTYCDMATAVGTVTTAAIPTQVIASLSARYPEIGRALASLVAQRYRGYVLLTRDLSLKTLAARLAQAVLRLTRSLGTRIRYRDREVSVLGPVVTQTDLGLMARGSRGNVNRVLKIWERSGWIAIEDRCILVLDPSSLERLSVDDLP